MKTFLKKHKQEVVALSGCIILIVLFFVLFLVFDEENRFSSVQDDQIIEPDEYELAPPPNGINDSHGQVNENAPSAKNSTPKNTSNDVQFLINSAGDEPVRDIAMGRNSVTGLNPNKNTPLLVKSLENSQLVEASLCFADIKEKLEKETIKLTAPIIAAPAVVIEKLPSLENGMHDKRARLFHVFKLHPNLDAPSDNSASSEYEAFEKAHKNVVELLLDVLLKKKLEAQDHALLEDTFQKTKVEAEKITKEQHKSVFYRRAKSIKEYVPNALNQHAVLHFTALAFFHSGLNTEFISRLELLFHVTNLRSLFGVFAHDFNANEFESEREKFAKVFFDNPAFPEFLSRQLLEDFLNNRIESVQKLVDHLKTVDVREIPEETPLFRVQPLTQVNHVRDIDSARTFCQERFINRALKEHFFFKQPLIENNKVFSQLKKQPGTLLVNSASSIEEIIDLYTPGPVLPVNQAVLSTPPHRGNLSVASSILQALTNFLPLFSNFSAGPTAENFKRVMKLLAKQSVNGLDFNISANPINACNAFLKDFFVNGFGLLKVCGHVDSFIGHSPHIAMFHDVFYPPRVGVLDYGIRHSIVTIKMIGHLYIYSFRTAPGQKYPKFGDIPNFFEMYVLEETKTKRYELYSVIFTFHDRAVAFVKRADGKWYDTNELKEPQEISIDSLPLKESQQSGSCIPIMAFYLRTE